MKRGAPAQTEGSLPSTGPVGKEPQLDAEVERRKPGQPWAKAGENSGEHSSGLARRVPATSLPLRLRPRSHATPSGLETSSPSLSPFTAFLKRGPRLRDHFSYPGHFMHIQSSLSHLLTPSPFLPMLFRCATWNSLSVGSKMPIQSSAFLKASYFLLTLALLRTLLLS